ncbi:MAG: GerAB/ArcD/ProY family transporter [Bacillota bacterium]
MNCGRPGRPEPGAAIGSAEAIAILATFTVLKVFLAAPERLTREGQTAAWAIPLLSALVSVLWVAPLVSVLNAYPGMDIIQITAKLAGRGFALAAGSTYYVVLLAILATGARQTVSALTSVALPNTPLYFLLAVGYAVIVLVPLWGLESLARATVIGGLYSYSMVALLPAVSLVSSYFVTPHRMDYLFPLLGPGVIDMAKICLVRQSTYFELLALGLLAPHIRERGGAGKVAWMSLVLSAFGSSLLLLALSLVFPYPSLARVPFPHLRVTRILGIGRFFQRLDALFVADWLTASLLGGALGVYVLGLTLASTFHLHRYEPWLFRLSGAVVILAAYSIPNLSMTVIAEYDIVRPATTVMLDTWPVSLFLLHRLRKRKSRLGSERR